MITTIYEYDRTYAVSDAGVVYEVNEGFYKAIKTWDTNGYKHVKLYKEGVRKTVYVHRLVAEYFLERSPNATEVNHKNGIKEDNRYENLEWCTHGENIRHAIDVLGMNRKRIIDIDSGEIFESLTEASKASGAAVPNISNVLNGKRKSSAGRRWRFI